MDFADARGWKAAQVVARIEAVIACAHEDVIDIAEDAAVGPRGDLGHELPFRERGMAETQIGRWILDEDLAPQKILRHLDVAADDVERFLGERQRQQVGEMSPIDRVPCEMLRDEAGLDALHEPSEPLELVLVEPFRASERKSDAMQ